MDFWNNNVGIQLSKTHRTKSELADAIMKALQKGELITNPDDIRRAEVKISGNDIVIVLKESNTDANEIFFDIRNSKAMSKNEFVAAILNGEYHGYKIRSFNGEQYPTSSRDEYKTNNLM